MDNEKFVNPDVKEVPAPVEQPAKKLALASIIVSIGAVVLLSLPAGIVAIVLAVKARKQGHTTPMPTVAIAVSILAMAVSLFVTSIVLSYYVTEVLPSLYPGLFEEEVTTEAELTDEQAYAFTLLEDGTYAISIAQDIELSGICAIPSEHNRIPVTAITENGFSGQSKLSRVLLPDSIRVLGDGAFENCDRLYSLTLGRDLTTVGARAFAGCAQLEELKLPDGVTVIGDGAFRDCAALKTLNVPAGVTRIEADTFRDCAMLTKVQLPQGVTFVGPRAFSGCAELTKLTLPDEITVLGAYALENCGKLTDIHIPTGVTVLSEGVFYGCAGVRKITLHEGITFISPRVFEECFLLKDIAVPLSVTDIVGGAFDSCPNLAALRYAGTMAEWEEVKKPDRWPATLLYIYCSDGKIRLSQ